MQFLPVNYENLAKLIKLIVSPVFLAIVVSCSSSSEVELSSGSKQGIPIPTAILMKPYLLEKLSACIRVGDGDCEPMTIDTENNRVEKTLTLSPGEHTFFIEFIYNSNSDDFGNNSDDFGKVTLAQARKTIQLTRGDNTLDFSKGEYYYPDEDNDSFINLIEIEHDSDPDDANKVPNVTTLPVIENIQVEVTNASAIITWDTDEATDSWIAYGIKTNFDNLLFDFEFDLNFVTQHELTLTELEPGTIYFYRLSSKDNSGIVGYSKVASFTTKQPAEDPTGGPVINNLHAEVTSSSATISWDTDKLADSWVEFGLDTGFGNEVSDFTNKVTSHTLTITDLTPETLFYFRVGSEDNNGNATISETQTFTTKSPPGLSLIDADSLIVREGGENDSYSLVLNNQPNYDVTITISSDSHTSVDLMQVVFKPNNWDVAQAITVSAISDLLVEGLHTSKLTHTVSSSDIDYDGLAVSNVSTRVLDPLSVGSRVAFVTSVTGNGDLSSWQDATGNIGLLAGDTICQKRADTSGLSGEFRAWLSDSFDDAYCRVHNYSGFKATNCGQSTLPVFAGPWLRVDGYPWAGRIDQMLSPNYFILAPAIYDEFANPVTKSISDVITGTNRTGTGLFRENCENWTNSTPAALFSGGGSYTIGASFTDHVTGNCDTDNRLLCLQTGTGTELPIPSSLGKSVFVTSAVGTGDLGGWPDAGGSIGLVAADAICNAKANGAGLSGFYKAWMSDSSTDAKDRITSDGPWVKLDGVIVANDKADLIDGSLFTGINMTENGAYLGNERAWTGTTEFGLKHSAACNDWADDTDIKSSTVGIIDLTINEWSNWTERACDGQHHLYCFED